MELIFEENGYPAFLDGMKNKIRNARIKASLSVNREMLLLYWEIGKSILLSQEKEGWGTKVIERLSRDLKLEFPDMKGFSTRNLKYMRKFAELYPDIQIVQEVLAQITWYHNIALIEKLDKNEERFWYAQQAYENGWSRNVLVLQIESKLYKRQSLSKKTTNFQQTLLSPQSDLAEQMLKDPYHFDFLNIGAEVRERDMEKALIDNITRFLLELGSGFAFVGRQYHLEVGGEDFYIDLLFYHLKLRCFVVIELKTGDFKPEYTGKMNFYLSAVDSLVKHPDDNSSIGIILCRSRNRIIAEYALRDINKPVGVSEFLLLEEVPEKYKNSLPTIEELESELEFQ